MLADWVDLQTSLGMTAVGLPRINPTHGSGSAHGAPPPTVFTQEIVEIVHELDSNMFVEFGYTQRMDVPFELK